MRKIHLGMVGFEIIIKFVPTMHLSTATSINNVNKYAIKSSRTQKSDRNKKTES